MNVPVLTFAVTIPVDDSVTVLSMVRLVLVVVRDVPSKLNVPVVALPDFDSCMVVPGEVRKNAAELDEMVAVAAAAAALLANSCGASMRRALPVLMVWLKPVANVIDCPATTWNFTSLLAAVVNAPVPASVNAPVLVTSIVGLVPADVDCSVPLFVKVPEFTFAVTFAVDDSVTVLSMVRLVLVVVSDVPFRLNVPVVAEPDFDN